MKKIFICTGGTGGHIFPAVALVEYLKKKTLTLILLPILEQKNL